VAGKLDGVRHEATATAKIRHEKSPASHAKPGLIGSS